MAPALAQFEQKYKDQVQVVEINVDVQSPEAQQYQKFKTSNYIPETAVLKDGTLITTKVGAMTVEELVAAMKTGQ